MNVEQSNTSTETDVVDRSKDTTNGQHDEQAGDAQTGKSRLDVEAEQRKQELAEQEAEAVHDAQVDQMVSEEKYFLTINKVEKKQRKFMIIGAIIAILLAVAWLDVALDAGLISNTYNLPHTSFFALKG